MARVEILSHWYHLLDGMSYSSQECYTSLEEAIHRREIPDIEMSRIEFTESAVLSAKREYLRITRKGLVIDICAAPFGSGFFFSWWLGKSVDSGPLLGLFILFGGIASTGVLMQVFGVFQGLVFAGIAVPALLLYLGHLVREGTLGIEDQLLDAPVLGRLYRWIFKPDTYYKIDTALMFQNTVHVSVQEVIDELTTTKGIRALSELERKPFLREFYQRKAV